MFFLIFLRLDVSLLNKSFGVNKILDKKVIGDIPHFLIRWSGWGADADSWEPETGLNCSLRIKEYEDRVRREQRNA